MDSQCDRCGHELKRFHDDYYEDSYECQHIVVDGLHKIYPSEPSVNDWEPGDEYDLCFQCHADFKQLWITFYNTGNRKEAK